MELSLSLQIKTQTTNTKQEKENHYITYEQGTNHDCINLILHLKFNLNPFY